jgi:hypothetical protein
MTESPKNAARNVALSMREVDAHVNHCLICAVALVLGDLRGRDAANAIIGRYRPQASRISHEL